MRRLCTDNERQLLYENKENMCMGTYKKTSYGKYSDVYISLAVFLALFVVSIVFIVDFAVKFISNEFVSRIIVYVWIMFLLFISRLLTFSINKKRRTAKEKKRFLKDGQFMINGATVIETDETDGIMTILYTEDDMRTIGGKPYNIMCPAERGDIEGMRAGDRLIAIYAVSGKDKNAIRLMKLNNVTRSLIDMEKHVEVSEFKSDNIECFLHPNCAEIECGKTALNAEDKEMFVNAVIEIRRTGLKKLLTGMGIAFFIILNLLATLLLTESGKGEMTIGKYILVYGCVNAGIAAYLGILNMISKKTSKKNTDFVTANEAVFISKVVNGDGTNAVSIYEWGINSFDINEYPNVDFNGNMGEVVYKLTTSSGLIQFIPREYIMK